MAMYEYHPVEAISLGKLPENDRQEVLLDVRAALEKIGVTGAKEFLIYTFVTTRDDSEQFQRGYYEMYTSENDQQYKKYMNVATGPAITTIDSANLWFPMGDGNLKITLIHPPSKKKSIRTLLQLSSGATFSLPVTGIEACSLQTKWDSALGLKNM